MTRDGDVLAGRYRIEALLGSGGMATVHRATDLRLGRAVAVKVLLPHLAQEGDLVERFDREARALAAVDHPAVVAIHDVEPGDPTTGREPFFVMELCDGGSLAERMAAAGPLPPDEVVLLATRIAEGLAALHARGIVHRDVKPHNILLSATGPKLADFGIARFDSSLERALTATGSALATLGYAAPEILAGAAATAASDVYGLGGVVYEALTGRRPRPADNVADAVESRLHTPDPPSTVAPNLGTAFDGALDGALSPEPARRPEALAFGNELMSALGQWARDRPRPTPARDPSPPAVEEADVWADPEAATSLVNTAAASPVKSDRARIIPEERGRRRAVSVQVLALGMVAGVALLIAATGWGRPATPGISPTDSAQPSVPRATITASKSPAQDPGNRVTASLEAVREAINGLKGDEAKDLRKRVDEIQRSLARDDAEQAGEEARELGKRIDELIREEKIAGEAADRVRDTADALLAALGVQAEND